MSDLLVPLYPPVSSAQLPGGSAMGGSVARVSNSCRNARAVPMRVSGELLLAALMMVWWLRLLSLRMNVAFGESLRWMVPIMWLSDEWGASVGGGVSMRVCWRGGS